MWKPPERIKHQLLDARWPTKEEASGSLLSSPLKVGSVTLEERTWVPAMVPWRATEEGFVTPEILGWYERFARGRPGAIVVEATGIRDIPSGPLLANRPRSVHVPGLAELVETVRRASRGHTRLFIQLIDFLTIRRRPEPEKFFRRYLEITDRHREAVGGDHTDEEIRELLLDLPDERLEEILAPRELEALQASATGSGSPTRICPTSATSRESYPSSFAEAARRAQAAGFDGVELHYAHAYTMASFLSALNRREDGYGGSRENRVRLPREVYERVRESVGRDFTVGCRFLSEECIEGGSWVEDAVFFGLELARAGMDFLSLSRGGKFEDAKQPKIGEAAYPYTGPSGYECMPTVISDQLGPFGRNVPAVARIRRAVRDGRPGDTPVVMAGGIGTWEQAEGILQRGEADLIAAARQSLADPDWFRKMRLGRGEEIRRCVYTNYCEGLDQKHKQVTCQLWDRLALEEPELQLSKDGKRRLTAPPWDATS